ncbi:MAG: ribonuclease P protein component [bacterium]|nr:ribonuclease P protein component [bacterium]
MLARKNRLTASSDIKNVVARGSRVRGNNIAIYSAVNPLDVVRFACVAGKKVHASSVVRHRVQRKIRAACAYIVTTWTGSYDIVVVAQSQGVCSMSVQDIEQEIKKGLPII